MYFAIGPKTPEISSSHKQPQVPEISSSHTQLQGITASRSQPQEILNTSLLTRLGPVGTTFLIQLAEYVPISFRGLRAQYYLMILHTSLHLDLSEKDVIEMLHVADNLDKFVTIGTPDLASLWKATFAFTCPLTMFLAPPLSKINVNTAITHSKHTMLL